VTVRGALGRLRQAADNVGRQALEPAGYHLTRRHFDSPIPVVEEIPPRLWEGPSELPRIHLRIQDALALLGGPLRRYLLESRPPLNPTRPGQLWLWRRGYEWLDADTPCPSPEPEWTQASHPIARSTIFRPRSFWIMRAARA